jgi:hypothetical protein
LKIKIITACAGLDFSFAKNQIVDIDKYIAKDLIKAGYAEEIKNEIKQDEKPVKSTKKSGGK